ncbi:hypothetical protein MNBD_ALPHA05-1379 [hydrothermal vent metagenome]|uniref:Transmembrane protein n=1 Tax=hydrothermal vent metagenome TaxID=652676 RepID=A0A3B0TCS1_9ZZZZ
MMRWLAILSVWFMLAPAQAAEIAIALTNDHVEVDTGFSGARLTLFGAISGIEAPAASAGVDIISVIRGPTTQFQIRRLLKRGPIWIPGNTHAIKDAPGLYLTNANRPITDIAPLPDQAAYRLGADFLIIDATQDHNETPIAAQSGVHNNVFAKAFVSEAKDAGLYRDRIGGVEFKKGALFAINVDIPANTPVGEYSVAVYLYQDGVLLGRDEAQLMVNKVGIERRIFDLAHNQPVTYGILSVVISLFAGWMAALAFRKS